MSILPSASEQKDLVAIARDKGVNVISFLEQVLEGNQNALNEVKPIPIALRLAAAELLRKYASLPTNIALEMEVKTKLEYVGDRDVKVVDAPALEDGRE